MFIKAKSFVLSDPLGFFWKPWIITSQMVLENSFNKVDSVASWFCWLATLSWRKAYLRYLSFHVSSSIMFHMASCSAYIITSRVVNESENMVVIKCQGRSFITGDWCQVWLLRILTFPATQASPGAFKPFLELRKFYHFYLWYIALGYRSWMITYLMHYHSLIIPISSLTTVLFDKCQDMFRYV
jgi:hypothetical protein